MQLAFKGSLLLQPPSKDSLLLLLGDEGLEGLAIGSQLLHLDEEGDTVADHLEELDLRVANAVSVGDIVSAVSGGSVDTTGTTLLKTEFVEDVIELLLVLGKAGKLDVDTGTETSSEIGWASEDESEMLIPHVLVPTLLHEGLDLGQALAETPEDALDVSTLLHRDDSQVILLVDPDQEGLGVVVPDATTVGPVTGHTSAGEEGRDGLVEEEVVVDQLILLSVRHLRQGVVLALEITLETREGIDGNLLDGTTLTAGAVRWERDVLDGAASADAGGEDILVIEDTALEVGGVQVGLVLGVLSVSAVAAIDDGVEKIGEDFVGLLVAGDAPHRHDEGVAGVVDARLDDAVESAAGRSNLVAELGVDLRGHALGHPVVVLAEVWVVLLGGVLLLPQVCHVDRRSLADASREKTGLYSELLGK